MGKEHRKPYRGGKAIDKTCRNHGGCPACEGNRKYSDTKRRQSADEKLKEYYIEMILSTEDGKEYIIKGDFDTPISQAQIINKKESLPKRCNGRQSWRKKKKIWKNQKEG